jgi:hypothetical protein
MSSKITKFELQSKIKPNGKKIIYMSFIAFLSCDFFM